MLRFRHFRCLYPPLAVLRSARADGGQPVAPWRGPGVSPMWADNLLPLRHLWAKSCTLRLANECDHSLLSRRRICLWALVNGNWLNRLWQSQRPCVFSGILAASRLEI